MKKLLLAIAAISAVIFPVRAAPPLVSYFDIPDVVLSPGQSGTLFLGDGTFYYDSDTVDGIHFSFNGDVPFAYGLNGVLAGTGSGFWIARDDSGSSARRHGFGDSLDFSVATAGASILGSPWDGDDGSTTGYLAIQSVVDAREGWIAVKFNDAANTLTLKSFAITTDTFNLRAGQTSEVPEPAETAAVMALLVGSVAVWRRHRKQTGTAASAV